jgi:hypothetical protein
VKRSPYLGLALLVGIMSAGRVITPAEAQTSPVPSGPRATGGPTPVQSTPSASPPIVGPSFPCPQPHDPLAQLFCEVPDLARLDLVFVQTYQALRQQLTPAGQTSLHREAVEFGLAVRADCGIAGAETNSPSAPFPPAAPPEADRCVAREYIAQRATWAGRLVGAAAEEANRSLEQQALLQSKLQRLGFLPPADKIDSVFGTDTRAATEAWQTARGLPVTGLLSDHDATLLLADAVPAEPAASTPEAPAQALVSPPAPVTPRPPVPALPANEVGTGDADWQNFTASAAALGIKLTYEHTSQSCSVLSTMDDTTFRGLTSAFIAGRAMNDAQARSWTAHSFTVGLLLQQAEFSAPTVKHLYTDFPDADACNFEVALNSFDVFGQPAPKLLYTFTFSRAIFNKINWEHFIPSNLAKIAGGFKVSPDAAARLEAEGGT